jgi:hypothetical protein
MKALRWFFKFIVALIVGGGTMAAFSVMSHYDQVRSISK